MFNASAHSFPFPNLFSTSHFFVTFFLLRIVDTCSFSWAFKCNFPAWFNLWLLGYDFNVCGHVFIWIFRRSVNEIFENFCGHGSRTSVLLSGLIDLLRFDLASYFLAALPNEQMLLHLLNYNQIPNFRRTWQAPSAHRGVSSPNKSEAEMKPNIERRTPDTGSIEIRHFLSNAL